MTAGRSGEPGERLAAALEFLGLDATASQRQALLRYLGLLQRWNGVYNLTAVRDPGRMLTQHIFDCLAAIPPLRREVADRGRIVDVGSGAGLPGVVLGIMEPQSLVTCVDSVRKKTSFIQQVAGELGLENLKSEHARIQDVAGPADVVTARAYADLPTLVSTTRHLIADGGAWMALKGRTPTQEIAALPAEVTVFHVEQLAVPELADARCVVWMRPSGH